ncbi:MAG: protein kinase [Polyangiales bacterium]
MAQKPSKLCPICGLRYDAAAAFCQKDGARLSAEGTVDPFLGEVLLGQFRIDEAIGAGGMGTVYRAHQMNLHRDVAVKILHPELTKNPDAVRRFHREAKVATSLEHPNLVRVFLFGELPDNGGLYLVMEHLEGRSLQELMRQEGALPLSRALHISAQLCEAIGAAHVKGIVHRDVKPENIIVLSRHGDPDFVKVLDFGIARLLWDEQSHMTQSGVIFGTARYISPEGAAGEFTDARSDVYSIGVLIYQLMTGVTPFDAKSPVSMLMKHVNEAAPDLRTMGHGHSVPTAIADVIMRSLAKNPDARYDTASAFGEALAAAAEASEVILPRARYSLAPDESMSAVPAVVRPPDGDNVTGMMVPGLGKKRRWPVLLAAFAIGAAAVVGGVMGAKHFFSEDPQITATRALETRAREALAAGRFETPPGDNVAELTLRILESQPRHEGALSLRREAAALLRERGTLARTEDNYEAAREAYRTALVFSPGDPAATQALEALDHAEEQEQPGLRLAPEGASVGDRITFLGIVSYKDEVRGDAAFEIHSGGRVVRTIDAVVVSDHHYVGGYAFRSAGEYMIRFVAPLSAGEVSFDVELTITRRGRVARRRTPNNNTGTSMVVVVPPEPTPNPWAVPQQGTVAPPNVQTMDDGNIDWTVPAPGMDTTTMQNDSAPPPWTGEGNVI